MRYLFFITGFEISRYFRELGDIVTYTMLFVLLVTLVPFGIGHSPEIQNVAIGFLWIGLLVTSTLALPMLFKDDLSNGIIEQYIMNHSSCELFVLAKGIAYWIASALPMLILAPILLSMLYIPLENTLNMVPALFIGSLGMTCLGLTAASLLLGNARAGALLMLVILPLYIPILIFGSLASQKALGGEFGSPEMLFICGLSLFFAAITLFTAPYLVRKAAE